MTGRVRCYLPAARRGILQTDAGEEYLFTLAEDHTDLAGGDMVEFELADSGQAMVRNVTLRRRWADLLNEQHRTLVNQFHHTVSVGG